MEIEFFRTDAENPQFCELVKLLDAGLAITDGDDHAFYDQFNKLVGIKYVVLAKMAGEALGCGAIKRFDDDSMEVKRMFVQPGHRGKGVAKGILAELEKWAFELGFSRCVLETGKRQTEAIALYLSCGYQVIPNYGQYIGMENSVCFEKNIVESINQR
jgi:GNAT superfamily N-acetyltransferase